MEDARRGRERRRVMTPAVPLLVAFYAAALAQLLHHLRGLRGVEFGIHLRNNWRAVAQNGPGGVDASHPANLGRLRVPELVRGKPGNEVLGPTGAGVEALPVGAG